MIQLELKSGGLGAAIRILHTEHRRSHKQIAAYVLTNLPGNSSPYALRDKAARQVHCGAQKP